MAMTAGTVSIADDGAETKSGMAGAIYDQLVLIPQNITPAVPPIPSGSAGAQQKRAQALLANALATALVTYMTANAQAKVPNSAAGDGLQTTPNPNNPATACTRPAADKFLAII